MKNNKELGTFRSGGNLVVVTLAVDGESLEVTLNHEPLRTASVSRRGTKQLAIAVADELNTDTVLFAYEIARIVRAAGLI